MTRRDHERQVFVRRVAGEMRALDSDAGDSVDLAHVAEGLGVTVRSASIVEDGRIVPSGDRIVVELRPDQPLKRQRFTLAHELAHVMLWRQESLGLWTADDGAGKEEELLCDLIANELLISADLVNACRERSESLLDVVRRTAHLSNTSLSAATLAVSRVTGQRVALSSFHRKGSRWTDVSSVGWPWDMPNVRWLCPADVRFIENLGSGDHPVKLTVCTPKGSIGCTGMASRSDRNHMIVLLTGWDRMVSHQCGVGEGKEEAKD